MKLFIVKGIRFLGFAITAYLLFLILWTNIFEDAAFNPNVKFGLKVGGFSSERFTEVKSLGGIDILFIGSSHAYRSFDTRVFYDLLDGIQSFNLGSSSQTPVQTEVLLKRYLHRLKPKLVVLEVYPITLSIEGVESAADILTNDVIDKSTREMVWRLNDPMVYNTYILAELSKRMRHIVPETNEIKSNITEKDTYVNGGFVETKLRHYSPKPMPESEIELNQSQLEALGRITEYLKRMNVRYILVYAPIPAINYKRFLNNNEFDSVMSKFGTYYNFNESSRLDDSVHFYDDDHLNQLGVIEFNKQLAPILEQELEGL